MYLINNLETAFILGSCYNSRLHLITPIGIAKRIFYLVLAFDSRFFWFTWGGLCLKKLIATHILSEAKTAKKAPTL